MTQYGNQLVVDLDFDLRSPIKVIHSLGSDSLFVSTINLPSSQGPTHRGKPGVVAGVPTFDFTDRDCLTVYCTGGRWRVYITVVPGI